MNKKKKKKTEKTKTKQGKDREKTFRFPLILLTPIFILILNSFFVPSLYLQKYVYFFFFFLSSILISEIVNSYQKQYLIRFPFLPQIDFSFSSKEEIFCFAKKEK